MTRRYVTIILWVAAILAALWWAYGQIRPPAAPDARQATQALVGGPFTLTSHLGETVTDQQLRGRYLLIYFGYTFCPDVCPLEVAAMDRAFAMLAQQGADTGKIQPVFISIDPERDDVAALKAFVGQYQFDLLGLTGTPAQIEDVKRAYRVYAAKAAATADDPEFYLMDHSSIIYLMDGENRYVTHFSGGTSAADIAAELAALLGS